MEKPIRIGIVDDHMGVRVAVRSLLAYANDMIVVGEGVNGAEAVQLVDSMKPDLLLLDIELPVMGGYEVVKLIREKESEVKVLALSSFNDPMYILGMLENGADGYITKDEAPSLLLVAIRSIMNEHVKWISPQVANQVSHIELENKTFTGKELEILRFIVLDKSNDEIMLSLDLNINIYKRYIELLMEKFNVTSMETLQEAAQEVISTSHD